MTEVICMTVDIRLARTVKLIEASLDDGECPSLEAMASAAAISKFHFHRVYRLMLGETPAETFRRLKLARAVNRLKSEDAQITTIAHDAGYSSSQAFAKALKSVLGRTASELRADGDRLNACFETLASGRSETALSVEMARTGPMKVLLKRHAGDPTDLDQTYVRLFEVAGGGQNVRAILGYMHSDTHFEAPDDQVFDAGLILNEHPQFEPPEYFSYVCEGAIWLCGRHQGSFDGISAVIDELMQLVIATDLDLLDDRPVMVHYLDDPESRPEAELRQDIYLPIRQP